MTLHCTENLHSCGARIRAVNTAVCPANHSAITAAKWHTGQISLYNRRVRPITAERFGELWLVAQGVDRGKFLNINYRNQKFQELHGFQS